MFSYESHFPCMISQSYIEVKKYVKVTLLVVSSLQHRMSIDLQMKIVKKIHSSTEITPDQASVSSRLIS